MLYPTEGRPSYNALYVDLYKKLGSTNFSLVPTANGAYIVSLPKAIAMNEMKTLANPTIVLGSKPFRLSTFEDDTQDYIIRKVPQCMNRDLLRKELHNAFGQKPTITNLRLSRKKIILENNEAVFVYNGDYIFTVANPPEITPPALHYGPCYLRIHRANSCYYCGDLSHMRKDCPKLKKKSTQDSPKKHQTELHPQCHVKNICKQHC